MSKSPETALLKASAERRAEGKRLRAKPEDRKAALDSVLLSILQSKAGVAGITLSNVAAQAACSTGTLGRYYAGSDKMRVEAVNLLAARGESPALRRVFKDGFDPKTAGLKLPKGFKVA